MSKDISRLGMSLFLYFFLGMLFQLIYIFVCDGIFEEESWYHLGIMLFPLYVCSFPLFLLRFRKMERKAPEKNKVAFGDFIKYILMTISIGFITIIPGALADSILLRTEAELVVAASVSGFAYRMLVTGIIAPVVEEFIFRKAIIDVVGRYNGFLAVFLSAVCFSFSHGNLTQLFFTFFVGLIWGYLYYKTGQLRHTIMLHIILNVFAILSSSLITGSVAYYIWATSLLSVVLAGLVIFIRKVKRIPYLFSREEIDKAKEHIKSCINVGLMFYFIFCGMLFYMTYTAQI